MTDKNKIPQFKKSSEQLVFYAKRFCLFCVDVWKDCGVPDVPSMERTIAYLDAIPNMVYISKVMDVKDRFAQELKDQNLSLVGKLVALYSESKSVEDMIEKMDKFTKYLEAHPEIKRKFFLYWTTMTRVIDGSEITGSGEIHS